MLDVHAPHEKIHGIKDFLLHLFTITVGLFIALALEGCVERVHQHHLRDEADRDLVQEIRDNDGKVERTRSAAQKENKNLIEVMKFLIARSASQPYAIPDISLDFSSSTLSDASWRTATSTGSLSFMEYARVQQFAGAYQVQDSFTRLEQQSLDQFLLLQLYVAYGFDPEKITPQEAKSAAVDVRRAISDLNAMDQIGEGLHQTYQKALAEK